MIEARIQLLILTVNKMFQGIKSERPAHVSANTPFLNNYVTSNSSNTHADDENQNHCLPNLLLQYRHRNQDSKWGIGHPISNYFQGIMNYSTLETDI